MNEAEGSGQDLDEILVSRAYLSAVAEAPAPALVRFVAERGVREVAERVHRDSHLPRRVADEVEARRAHVSGKDLLDVAESVGARLVVPEHREWPGELLSCFSDAAEIGMVGLDGPLALWVRGSAPVAEVLANAVAVVGTRAASGYGEQVATEFGNSLASHGFTVVSGAAYGIDGAAHRGALAAQRPTVAFLACGLDRDYPAGHGRLLHAISERGLVISEYAPGTTPRKHRFLVRNRLIAAAGRGTVVVEAGARSGASNTASSAECLGRPVMALPGPITAMHSVGCHEMVRSGKALLVTTPEQVLEVITPLGQGPVEELSTPQRATDELDPVAQRVYDALRERNGASAEELAQDAGLPLRKVRASLPALEMAGLVLRKEDGWCRRGR